MASDTGKRVGRPPGSKAADSRGEMLRVRLTAQERAQLQAAAAKHGFKGMSDYVRSVALERDMLN